MNREYLTYNFELSLLWHESGQEKIPPEVQKVFSPTQEVASTRIIEYGELEGIHKDQWSPATGPAQDSPQIRLDL